MSGSPIILSSWLLNSVLCSVDAEKQYTSDLIASDVINPHARPRLVKIVRWVLKSSSTNDMNAIVCDGTHHMFVIIPFRPTIVDFELRYQQRITYETVNTHMVVHKARLRFALVQELTQGFKSRPIIGLPIVILEINELAFFLRDKYESNGSDKPFIYETPNYAEVCRGPGKSVTGEDSEDEDLMLMMNS